MYTEQLSQALSIQGKIDPQSLAAATPTGTSGVDMRKFRRATFLLMVGAFGSSATVDMKLQTSPDNSTWSDLAGTGVPITTLSSAGGNDREATLEVDADQMPTGTRYVQALVTVGTAATLVACLALGGEAIAKPGAANDITSVAQRSVVV
jgi:hypothetical protein